MLAFCRFRKSI